MTSSNRDLRVAGIVKRPCPPAGQRAMLRTPSLVTFTGSCAYGEGNREPIPLGENLVELEPEIARPAADALRLDEAQAAPVPVEDFLGSIVASAADTMAMLAEHRVTRPMPLRRSREARILALVDAIFATGERAISDVLGWWERARDDGNPWALWPPVLLLGLIDGPEGLLALVPLIEALRPGEDARVDVAANALSVVTHPGVVALAQDLLASESSLARAIGLETLSRRGEVDLDRISLHLDATAPALIAAALRALVRDDSAPPAIERVLPFLRHANADVAWEAARALTMWGAPDALSALRAGQPLGAVLGARAVELFVMAGDADITYLEALVGRLPITAGLLDAIGRFGNPGAWSFLIHFLADPDLGETAERALFTLFGPLVTPDGARRASAWRDALAERGLDPAVRYRGGEPWTPARVARDCSSALLPNLGRATSQRTVERWLDELAARTAIPMNVDLAPWGSEANVKLLAASERASGARWHAGAWNMDRRGAERRRS